VSALLRLPLLRLLAVNLAAGCAVALMMLGGLLALDPGGLRELILADDATGLALLAFGFVVTFGSAAMGSAVMMLGRDRKRDGGGKAVRHLSHGERSPAVAPAKAGG
jgi:hypothetical protein